jgi:site-specific DNA-adenine methylase
MLMSLTDFKAKMNKPKINKYKFNNNNKTNTKHEFNVKYERYKPNFYRQIFKILKFMFFMEGTQKKMKLSSKVITHPSFASFFACLGVLIIFTPCQIFDIINGF